jgi:molybdopterin converting factor subunit 1
LFFPNGALSFAFSLHAVPLRAMTVAVLLFASYAEALGGERITVDLPAGASVRDLVEHVRRLPGADRLPPTPLVAVNQQYATTQQRLTSGDEVALIPPVAGG